MSEAPGRKIIRWLLSQHGMASDSDSFRKVAPRCIAPVLWEGWGRDSRSSFSEQSSCGFSGELTLLNCCFVVSGFLSSEGCGFKYSCKWDFSGLCSPFSSATGSHLCVLLLRLQLFSHYFLTVLSCSSLSTHLKNTVDLGLLHGVRGWHWPSLLSHLESAHHSYLFSTFHVLHRL